MGTWGHLGGGAHAYRLDRSTHGLMFGVDTELTDSVRGGVVLGYTDSSFKGDAQGRVRADGFHALAYADQRWQDWSLRGGLAYSWYSLDTRRSLNFANWGTATSRTHAQASQVFAELAYDIEVGGIGVEPYAGLAYTHLRQHGFSEDNSPVALQALSVNHGLTISTLGIRGSVLLEQGRSGALQATAGLGWRHAMGDIRPTRDLQFATGPTYQIVGVPVARNAMVADLGVEWSTSARSRVSITYSGQIAGRTQDHGLHASVRWVF